MTLLRVVAAAVLCDGRLLVTSKQAAPDVFYLPGGKPEPGESDLDCLRRELREELGVEPADPVPLGTVRAPAALEGVPMDLAVYATALRGTPGASAEIASLAWWPDDAVTLAPAIRDLVVPQLEEAGRLTRPSRVVVRRVTAARTLPLRSAVLRPGQDPSVAVNPDDDAPDTWFLAALAPDGRVLSTVNIRPGSSGTEPADGTFWWRLRGMATAPEARGRGYAREVVAAALAHVDSRGDGIWCNARTTALGFYAKLGFARVGEPWLDPHTGPHVRMVRPPLLSGGGGRGGSAP